MSENKFTPEKAAMYRAQVGKLEPTLFSKLRRRSFESSLRGSVELGRDIGREMNLGEAEGHFFVSSFALRVMRQIATAKEVDPQKVREKIENYRDYEAMIADDIESTTKATVEIIAENTQDALTEELRRLIVEDDSDNGMQPVRAGMVAMEMGKINRGEFEYDTRIIEKWLRQSLDSGVLLGVEFARKDTTPKDLAGAVQVQAERIVAVRNQVPEDIRAIVNDYLDLSNL